MVDNQVFDALSSQEAALLLTSLPRHQQQNETLKKKEKEANRDIADLLKDLLSGPLEKKILSEEEKRKKTKDEGEGKEKYDTALALIRGLRETSSYSALSRASSTAYSAPSTAHSPYGFGHSFYESEYKTYTPTSENTFSTNAQPEAQSAVISSEEYSHYIMRFTIAQAIGSSTLGIVNYELKRKADYFTMFMHNAPFVTLKLMMTGLGVGYEMPPETMTTNSQAA